MAVQSQKYSVNQYLIETLLSWVKSGEIAIPEIQRPFVWEAAKVRDLMDSLYKGYPVGYIIAWRSANIKLKDGSFSDGKKILIDGQQRITALTAALLGDRVVDKTYQKIRIKIAFNPEKELFEVSNPAIERNSLWIADIAPLMSGEEKIHKVVRAYLDKNPDVNEDQLFDRLEQLTDIAKKQIGMIELAPDLDIETVTEIFIRINSAGVVLSQADFAMSKIAANEALDGHNLRKGIDYFCHLAIAPEFLSHIEQNDSAFTSTDYFKSIKWLGKENDDLYDPSYNDLLRVALLSEFKRGKFSDLVSLLSGRNFEQRTYERSIEEDSFAKLAEGVKTFSNETNFKRFIMIIRSAGFIDKSLIRSRGALNFAYALYLILKRQYGNTPQLEGWVKRWFVMSMLTGRYSSSPESQFDYDIKQIAEKPFEDILQDVEASELSDAFWDLGLVQNLTTSSINIPAFKVFLAAQVYLGYKGFLSRDITVKSMLETRGDIHHVFPKAFLKKKGLTIGRYNQIANLVYLQQDINIAISDKQPAEYMQTVFEQCQTGDMVYGSIVNQADLEANLAQNALPIDPSAYAFENYDNFLTARRQHMAKLMKDYYQRLSG
ncbi:GmrSD restriction endonuclease domain-containing protein [Thiomicrospira cyclica]|uniref:GmrSD restriction endonucleases N-terminal domain-containing protein n=1 Tax=Thiomicrospira cyclica (strain DSM 14477 / JCM 11371 / ALM1) TaxID=717773 RepID=F6DBS1_THICA|nr:DUF262 domain-containing protein [Thiomicrospira cyclica]AEG31307.1 Protein of unknown function DUF2081 [Thiomicrospira cyclica ALM1]